MCTAFFGRFTWKGKSASNHHTSSNIISTMKISKRKKVALRSFVLRLCPFSVRQYSGIVFNLNFHDWNLCKIVSIFLVESKRFYFDKKYSFQQSLQGDSGKVLSLLLREVLTEFLNVFSFPKCSIPCFWLNNFGWTLDTGLSYLNKAGQLWIDKSDLFHLSLKQKIYIGGLAFTQNCCVSCSGSFFRREGRPKQLEMITARLTDRPLRPMIKKGWNRDTQILSWLLSFDGEAQSEALSITAAGAALAISGHLNLQAKNLA